MVEIFYIALYRRCVFGIGDTAEKECPPCTWIEQFQKMPFHASNWLLALRAPKIQTHRCPTSGVDHKGIPAWFPIGPLIRKRRMTAFHHRSCLQSASCLQSDSSRRHVTYGCIRYSFLLSPNAKGSSRSSTFSKAFKQRYE